MPSGPGRDAEARRLRGAGWASDRIAEHLGYLDADDAVMGIARAITAHFRAVAEELRCRPLTLADLRQMALKAGVPPAEVYGESGEDDGAPG